MNVLVDRLISQGTSRHPRVDPIKFQRELWPHVEFFREQEDIIYSVVENDETFVVAANMMGKDFTSAYVVLAAFLTSGWTGTHRTVRIVTTSVKDDHLRVLWGEIGRFVQSCKVPLTLKDGGPLVVNHRDIRKVVPRSVLGSSLDSPTLSSNLPRISRAICDISYLRGMVSERGEGLAGHHAEYTLGVIDEASGVDNFVYTQMGTWAKRILVFGNANDCAPTQFFRAGVKGGNLVAEE